MKALQIESSAPKLTEDDLAVVEHHLHTRLPRDFRSFLLSTNGGDVQGFFFKYDERSLWISRFFPIILSNFQNTGHFSPIDIPFGPSMLGDLGIESFYLAKKFLVIATVVDENMLLLSLDEERYGAIDLLLWDRINFRMGMPRGDVTEPPIVPLCASFDELLKLRADTY